MKRIISVILCISCIFLLTSCFAPPIREYGGTALSTLIYQTVDYMGGYTVTYIFDFDNNVAEKQEYLPYADEYEGNNAEFDIIKEFTDEEEAILINKLYSYGLFNIRDNYKSPPNIMDGGGWSLIIEYTDGTSKQSEGSNNAPRWVFKNCAKAFYDLCENGVLAFVPEDYYRPPNLSYSFHSANEHYGYAGYGERLDYSWNGFGSTGNDAYESNESMRFSHEFNTDENYSLILYTANYRNSYNYDKFTKCTLRSYDYNEKLTNEKTVYQSGWFKQVEIDLELNRIYILRLDFKNGDFVEYTFNTKVDTTNLS